MNSTEQSNQQESQPIAKQAVMRSLNTPVKRLFDMLFQNLTPTKKTTCGTKKVSKRRTKNHRKSNSFWMAGRIRPYRY